MPDQAMWYIEHRIEYLDHQLQQLRRNLELPIQEMNLEMLAEFMEMKGRVKELRHLTPQTDSGLALQFECEIKWEHIAVHYVFIQCD